MLPIPPGFPGGIGNIPGGIGNIPGGIGNIPGGIGNILGGIGNIKKRCYQSRQKNLAGMVTLKNDVTNPARKHWRDW